MKVIIAGGRDFDDYDAVERAVKASRFAISEVVSGACGITEREYWADYPVGSANFRFANGADGLGERWAHKHCIHFVRIPAEWNAYGKSAGPKRNAKMAEYADALIAMPGGKGTASMIQLATKHGLKVYTYES